MHTHACVRNRSSACGGHRHNNKRRLRRLALRPPKTNSTLPRDHPRHIYGRFAAVALSSVFAVALYARVATPRCLADGVAAAALGLRLDGSTTAALKGAACVAVLYLGTLAERLVLGAFTLPEINPRRGATSSWVP